MILSLAAATVMSCSTTTTVCRCPAVSSASLRPPSLRALELGGKLDALGPPPDRSGLPQSDVEILQRVGADDGVLPAILVNMLVPSGREQEGIGA
jgi:hypothetical protein